MPTNWMVRSLLVLALLAPCAAAQGIDERLAAAKLAETRGDLPAAEQELRAALAAVTRGVDRERVDAALQALLARAGRAAAGAPQGAPAGDPVQRLIATLEQGSEKLPEVKAAVEQLDALGALAVPPLLAVLPQLGPFGLANALRVLRLRSDPRIAAALLQRIDGGDPATVEAIAWRLRDLQAAVALPVATEIARRDVPPLVAFAAFQALVRRGAEPAQLRELALRLAKDPATQDLLPDELDDVCAPWRDEPVQVLLEAKEPHVRSWAVLTWLRAHPDAAEDDALRLLDALPEEQRVAAAGGVADLHRDWVRVALLGLRGVSLQEFHSGWTARTEWWRAPELAAPALLAWVSAAPDSPNVTVVAAVFARMASKGWMPAPALDADLARLAARGNDSTRFTWLVRALPPDAEDRALAIQEALGQEYGWAFVTSVVAVERPWHRVVARGLASIDRAGNVPESWVARDWTGAPAEATAALTALTRRFAADRSVGQVPWPQAVIDGYRRGAGITVDVVMPFVEAGNLAAFAAVAERDPQRALAYARATPIVNLGNYSSLDGLLRRHGTAADVPLAVRCLVAIDAHVPQHAGVRDFLARIAGGSPEVIALGRRRPERDSGQQIRIEAAKVAAKGARVEDLPALLALLPELDHDVVPVLRAALLPQLRREHAAPIAAALDRMVEMLTEPGEALFVLLHWLGVTADPQTLPNVRRMLAHPRAAAWGVERYAAAMALAVAGPQRAAVLAELLAAPSGPVVAPALLAPELRTDASLRAAAKDAILRLGPNLGLDDAQAMFDALDAPERTAFARELLADERFAALQSEAAIAAVQALGTAKPADAITVLARAAAHRSSDVRLVVARELGRIFSRDAAPPLLELLKDRDEEVRKQAQQSLEELARYLDAKEQWDKRLK
jgi:hypothetical protein